MLIHIHNRTREVILGPWVWCYGSQLAKRIWCRSAIQRWSRSAYEVSINQIQYWCASNFQEDRLYIADPKVLQHILQKSGYNYKNLSGDNGAKVLRAGRGLFWAEGILSVTWSCTIRSFLLHRRASQALQEGNCWTSGSSGILASISLDYRKGMSALIQPSVLPLKILPSGCGQVAGGYRHWSIRKIGCRRYEWLDGQSCSRCVSSHFTNYSISNSQWFYSIGRSTF